MAERHRLGSEPASLYAGMTTLSRTRASIVTASAAKALGEVGERLGRYLLQLQLVSLGRAKLQPLRAVVDANRVRASAASARCRWERSPRRRRPHPRPRAVDGAAGLEATTPRSRRRNWSSVQVSRTSLPMSSSVGLGTPRVERDRSGVLVERRLQIGRLDAVVEHECPDLSEVGDQLEARRHGRARPYPPRGRHRRAAGRTSPPRLSARRVSVDRRRSG